jgi:hypothetical protein
VSDATSTTSRGSVAGILTLVGGALTALGSFLSWARVDAAGASISARGTDGWDGYATAVCGIVLILYGIGRMTGAAVGARRAFGAIAVGAGLIGGGVALYDASVAKREIVDQAAAAIGDRAGIPTTQARGLLDAAISSGQVTISLALGIYVVMIGGGLGVSGGIAGLTSDAAQPSPPMRMIETPPPPPPFPFVPPQPPVDPSPGGPPREPPG